MHKAQFPAGINDKTDVHETLSFIFLHKRALGNIIIPLLRLLFYKKKVKTR
jgi:hypothetical protein